jgi:hypothetical protein
MGNFRRVCFLAFAACLVFSFRCPDDLRADADNGQTSAEYQSKVYFAQTRQEVTVHHIRGEESGPTLLIIAGMHGDEAGGYLTAERYTSVRLKKGNLIIVPQLNGPAVRARKRYGLGGDMNRLFNLPSSSKNPDAKVVNLAKQLVRQSDYVLNLHQGYDFYNPRWISPQRNPSKWGQSNVIDTATFHMPSGQKVELGNYAKRVVHRTNSRIPDGDYHFAVNNTNTAVKWTRHQEQRGSLTYYSLYNQQKIALGLEATKNCSLADAISYLTIAVNAAIAEAGIEAVALPSEADHSLGKVKEAKSKNQSKVKLRG